MASPGCHAYVDRVPMPRLPERRTRHALAIFTLSAAAVVACGARTELGWPDYDGGGADAGAEGGQVDAFEEVGSRDAAEVGDAAWDGSDAPSDVEEVATPDSSEAEADEAASCVSCPLGAACVAGTCACPTDWIACGGECVEPKSDPRNCGGCGIVCNVGCAGGTCLRVTQVDSSGSSACAVLSDRSARCWGRNDHGQLGDASTTDRPRPTPVVGVADVVEVGVGWTHACARQGDGSVWCWGLNMWGQLGDGTSLERAVPAPVPGLADVRRIVAGAHHTCALRADGSVVCWGANWFGELGDGTTVDRASPVVVKGLPAMAGIAAYTASCAWTHEGVAWCWGLLPTGRLLLPVPVPALANVVGISLGYDFACARLGGGGVECWGRNNAGQLGDGEVSDRMSPGLVSGPSDAEQLDAGHDHACVLAAGGAVRCWGDNTAGETGSAPVAPWTVRQPVPVTGLANVVQLSAGYQASCALLADGDVACWGANLFGGLGDGTTVLRAAPARVRW